MAQSRGVGAEWLYRFACRGGEPEGFPARGLKTDESGIGGFLRGEILARALAEFFARLSDVENVVDDLEGQSHFGAECRKRRELTRRGICGQCAELETRADHCSRLAFVNEA